MIKNFALLALISSISVAETLAAEKTIDEENQAFSQQRINSTPIGYMDFEQSEYSLQIPGDFAPKKQESTTIQSNHCPAPRIYTGFDDLEEDRQHKFNAQNVALNTISLTETFPISSEKVKMLFTGYMDFERR